MNKRSKIIAGAFTAAMGAWLINGLWISATALDSSSSQFLKHEDSSTPSPSDHFFYDVEEASEDEVQPALYHVRVTGHGHTHTVDENWRVYCPTRQMRKTSYRVFDVEGELIQEGNAWDDGAFSPRNEAETGLVDDVCGQ